ncbi:MAG: diguanylate cyclase [Planctomycetota bacterium]|nr:diguanylate cyclase [Planctomycetota bacterium]
MSDSFSDNSGLVMIVDADDDRSARWCDQLASAGWRTVRAATPAEATAAVRRYEVDVVILHAGEFPAEAADLPAALRADADTPSLPVIIVSRQPDEKTRCRFLNAGADDIAGENISPVELDARLRALLRGKILHDELRESKRALSASLRRERALLKQLRRDNAHLLTMSTTDPLTRLQNIRYFDSFLENQFRVTRRYNRSLSLLAFDLDHFKVVNDTYGHPSGDYVLKEFAVILKCSVRDSDVVARTGGEEFSIILPDADPDQSRRFAQRIRQAVSERKFIVFGHAIHVTTSIGAATYPENAEITDPHLLVYMADQALLRAKQLGRDRFVSVDEMDWPTRRQLRRQFQKSGQRPLRSKVDPLIAADVRR